ncbi:hypothetical protein [Pirellulimonas nuda]|uniref:hypothetical protein n=1 Tax=Pirellulimonas nuda TaxID=2528009 RepID=UPI00119E00DA|nr:hypothetical protein [Pirellulimonas nuda]
MRKFVAYVVDLLSREELVKPRVQIASPRQSFAPHLVELVVRRLGEPHAQPLRHEVDGALKELVPNAAPYVRRQ